MYKPVIGLEIHAELRTKTKMFCDSLNDPDEKHPNINVCPICMGHPGTLPVANEDAVKKVIMAGLALNCKIEKDTFFERKNYFYPDLPKGYQISQYQKPLCYGGWLDIETRDKRQETGKKKIKITRIHLEEDAGRLYHLPNKDYSLVDFNRAGVPLMELVTEPDLESGEEVRKFAEELRLILRYLGVSDADMEKGQMRVEVNISLRDKEQETSNKFGIKVEIKNINSIKFAADAVDYEIKRQTELLEAGEKVKQETRGWDEQKGATFSQRSKEEAQDYRYFPEPDLPPLLIRDKRQAAKGEPRQGRETRDQGIFIDEITALIPELPQQRRERFARQYSLPEKDIDLFTTDKTLGDYFEHVASELLSFDKLDHLKRPEPKHQQKLFKLASNYIITELKRMAEEVYAEPADTKISPEMMADLVVRIFHGEVSSSGAQTALKEMFATGASPGKVIEEKDLAQLSNIGDLEMAVSKVIADNPKAIGDFKKGSEAPIKFLIGAVMRETKGKANPQIVEQIIKRKLKI
ncbi:MAG: glutaminyl-tRNA synthase (glutamine-hydrolyzing) subunit B [Candidatus Yanofskybacteria bacterium RIFCSPHIGHO2_01_FULL_43_42]|uniref:Aspartyl/glutamyl-tRNA(Asn/Gln) amidotransferase subunit B n=1 Tax=Candidatus Yanofskybacteria bacterium RIFCSPLOWO2_01_FULL_43_22 TaxID=1802695 RepID=A0A1F8GGG0_9BACT|nr:MAG: glutaminyl-tRNA synthase (glutamine-hydrolyzing) subunit B [Candidatus Yanofskybacteria bacterium RIFCSPHIGHO2_01_FULL_43_42]OGN13345.1 MAG: glutaminyl-tRNA synthase (glutamine-hydrolyzing) subunit B [Candidatus Yanofskybacteria bacterium RIFCSPHIGHO2_02_FULL_43_17]OGN24391.1 MAG: glutaminyl-tRNA synthase (glutamine-hydrolyzing) subunit B [Candidatus Yanofskybacteria bacterium RIFCSPLOWO2_01_FULL_43_22]